jgi:hypothetical protein
VFAIVVNTMVIQKMMDTLGLGSAAKKAAAEDTDTDATEGKAAAANALMKKLQSAAGKSATGRKEGEALASKPDNAEAPENNELDQAEDSTPADTDKEEETAEKDAGEEKKSSGFATAMKWILGLAGVGVVIYIAKAMFFSKK